MNTCNSVLHELAATITAIEDQEVAINFFKELHTIFHNPDDQFGRFTRLAHKLEELKKEDPSQ